MKQKNAFFLKRNKFENVETIFCKLNTEHKSKEKKKNNKKVTNMYKKTRLLNPG